SHRRRRGVPHANPPREPLERIGRMLRELLSSRPARDIRAGPLVGSVVVHAALIVAVLATTRHAGPNSHAANQLAREATPVVHLQYLTLLPSDLPGKAPSASEKRATAPRRSALDERPSAKARLATIKKTLREITDRLAEVRPTFDVTDVVNNTAV